LLSYRNASITRLIAGSSPSPVLRPPGLIVEVVTHNDHATIAAQDCLSATTASVSDIDGLTVLKAWVLALR
jgi:hypothetical protein